MKPPFLPALLSALCLIASACDSKKTPASSPAPPADPTGKWEIRDDGLVQPDGSWPKKEHYLFTRYEFKSDGSFVREFGASSVPADTQRVSGSWKVEAMDPPAQTGGNGILRKRDQVDELKEPLGVPVDKAGPVPARGTLVLSYSVKKKDDIPVGATLMAGRGPVLEPPVSFNLQERLRLSLRESTPPGNASLTVGTQTFRRIKP